MKLLILCFLFVLPLAVSMEAHAKDAIPCVEKNSRGRWVMNKRRTCIQYTVEEEKWTQKKLTVLVDYIKTKEPNWRKDEKKYLRVVVLFEKSKAAYLKRLGEADKLILSKDKDIKTWKTTFLNLQKERVPPEKKFWENPWFWSTAAAVIVTGVVIGIALNSRFGVQSSNLTQYKRPLTLGVSRSPRIQIRRKKWKPTRMRVFMIVKQ